MARRTNRRARQPAPGWVWMLFGLGLGLVVAAGVYVQGGRAPQRRAPPAAAARAAPVSKPNPPAAAANGAPAPQAATPRTAKADRPAAGSGDSRFDFYEILPRAEVVVPEVETAAQPPGRARPVDEPGSYVLQAGSFQGRTEADRLKASIALLGIESRIQRVTIDDDVFYRVRVGPITDLDKLNRIRGQLHDARIETVVMKAAE